MVKRNMYKMLNIASGNWSTQMIYTICRLDIPDIIREDPMSISELASITKTDENSLYRLMRAVSSMGIFQEVIGSREFIHTDLSLMLKSSHSSCIRSFCLMRGSYYQYSSWSNLLYSVQTGRSALEYTCGMSMFEYLSQHVEERQVFQDAMSCITRNVAREIVEDHLYLFDNAKKIVDIGGGEGILVQILLQKLKDVQGIILDIPSVTSEKVDTSSISYVGGDFFHPIPVRGDVYILKYILHDWSDEKCIQILKNISDIMTDGDRLFIIESPIPENNDPSYHKMLDIQMMVCLDDGAKERTLHEYQDLLHATSLSLTQVVPLKTLDLNILIAQKSTTL